MEERLLVRRVATAACVLALLTMPLIRLALGDHESWIAGAHFVVLGLALLGLGRRGMSLGVVIGATAGVLWVITLLSFWRSTGTVVGGAEVVGYGSGPLWLSTAMGPLLFLAFPVRRALTLVLGAVTTFVLVFAVRARGAAGVLVETGLWFQLLAIVLVVGATAAVALLARRSAQERAEAEELRRQAAEERSELAAAQQRRRDVFSRTAADLRAPMHDLTRASETLAAASAAEIREAAERVAVVSSSVLDQIVGSLRDLVTNAHSEAPDDAPPADDDVAAVLDPASARHDRVGLVVVLAVVLVVLVDALRLAALLQLPDVGGAALALAGSRMVLVLFLGAAIVAVRRPDRVGWSAVVLTVLLHPVAVLSAAGGTQSAMVVQTLVPAWRNGVLSTTFIVLLSAIIERRARERDAARQEAADDVASSRSLRAEEAAAELTYAEAAHELKNPLSVITAGARTIADRATITAEQQGQLRDVVVRSTARLDERLRAMRTVAGVEDETPARAPRIVDVQDRLAVAVADAVHGAAPVELDVRCAEAQVVIVPGDLDQVIENLVGNALAYGEDGGPVRVEARVHDGEVHVEVANRGGTLSAAQAPRVFEAYWRAANGDHPAGSGLGLAIVARLVDGWHGTCWCSVSEGWTRVGFTIPLAGVEAEADTADGRRLPTMQA